MIGMAWKWHKNDLKCQFSSFPGMIGMTLEWLRNDWKCHFSSFLGMIGMTSEWWFDSFNAHSYHSCHSWFFCVIPSFQPHSAIQKSFKNDEQWGKWGMTSNEWPKLTTFPRKGGWKQIASEIVVGKRTFVSIWKIACTAAVAVAQPPEELTRNW